MMGRLLSNTNHDKCRPSLQGISTVLTVLIVLRKKPCRHISVQHSTSPTQPRSLHLSCLCIVYTDSHSSSPIFPHLQIVILLSPHVVQNKPIQRLHNNALVVWLVPKKPAPSGHSGTFNCSIAHSKVLNDGYPIVLVSMFR